MYPFFRVPTDDGSQYLGHGKVVHCLGACRRRRRGGGGAPEGRGPNVLLSLFPTQRSHSSLSMVTGTV